MLAMLGIFRHPGLESAHDRGNGGSRSALRAEAAPALFLSLPFLTKYVFYVFSLGRWFHENFCIFGPTTESG
jgi:hypothetical protein